MVWQLRGALQRRGMLPAEPLPTKVPKCLPGCSPAKPCMEQPCPGNRPEYTGRSGFDRWSLYQKMGRWRLFGQRRDVAPPPNLRCERDLACGLFKVP